MQRFFMHIEDDEAGVTDPEGTEFSTLDDARRTAVDGAREIISQRVKRGWTGESDRFVIADDLGRTVLVVPFRDAISGNGPRGRPIDQDAVTTVAPSLDDQRRKLDDLAEKGRDRADEASALRVLLVAQRHALKPKWDQLRAEHERGRSLVAQIRTARQRLGEGR